MTHALDKGATVRLPVTSVRAVLRWSPRGSGGADVELSALLLGGTGRVRSPGDFVFYNQPRHPTGLVRRLPKRRDGHGLLATVEAELARLDGRIDAGLVRRHRAVLSSVGLPTGYAAGAWPGLRDAMRVDKKARGSVLRFIVLDGTARPTVLSGPSAELLDAAYQAVAAD